MSLSTYKKRSGTADRGKDYEWLLCAFYALKFTTSSEIADFELFANSDFFGDFDDVALRTEFNDGSVKVFLLQLKHSEKAKTLTLNSLASPSGDFTLLKYKKSHDEILSLDNFDFILYTNRTARFKDNTKMVVQDKEIYIRQFDHHHLLNTNKARISSVFKFEINQKWDFFKNFYLYVNQQNDVSLKQSISDLLSSKLYCDIYTTFIEFMRGWWAGNFKLSKYDVGAKLAELVFSPMVKTLDGGDCNHKTKLIEEAILRFDLTLVESLKITKIWTKISERRDMKRVSLTALKYGLTTKGIAKMEELSLEKQTKVLWFMDELPLVIEFDGGKKKTIEAMISVLGKCKMKKKLVLVGAPRLNFTNWEIFENLSNISDDLRKTITKTLTCSLQGKSSVTLEELGAYDSQLTEAFRVHQLLEIATTHFNIGESLETLPPVYIPRSFYKVLLNYTIIDRLTESKIFLSYNNQKVEQKFKKRPVEFSHNNYQKNFFRHHVFVSQTEFTQDVIKESSETTHHFRVVDNQNLQWLMSNENIEELRPDRRRNVDILSEDQIDQHFHNRIKIFTSHTGTGKTSFLNRIKNQAKSNRLVIKINLKDHSEFFKRQYQESAVWNQILRCTTYNCFETEIVKNFARERTVLMWDGVDDLARESLDSFLLSVKELEGMGLSQWIAGQNNHRQLLEDALGVFAMTFVPFCQDEQIYYIENRCGVQTKNFFENMKIIDNEEYLGVPLQLYILTDIFCKDPKLLERIYTLTDIFAAYIEGKYNQFIASENFSTKSKNVESFIEDAKINRLEQYKIAALKTHVPALYRKLSLKNGDKFLDGVRSGDFLGLIERMDGDGGFVFEHQILGEYLTALFLSENRRVGLDEFIFRREYRNIRFLFDLLLAKNEPTFLAILYKKFDQIGSCLVRDDAGRNPLHLICSYGNAHCQLESRCERGLYKIKRVKTDTIQESDVLTTTVKKLTAIYDPLDKDDLFHFTSFDYADRSGSLGLIELLPGRLEQIVPKLRMYDAPVVLYYSLKMNYFRMFSAIKDIPYVEDDHGVNLIHLATEFERENYIKQLLSRKNHLVLINKPNNEFWTPLHIATFNGNLNLIKLLIEKGASFKLRQPSVMSLATAKGRKDIVEFFLECGCSPNEFYHTNHFTSSIFQAVNLKHDDILDLLLKNGAKLLCVNQSIGDKPNPFGMNLFHMLLENEQFEQAEAVLQKGIHIDSVDFDERTAFHHAACNNQTRVATFLLSKGANCQVLDKNRRSPLHCAAENGSLEVGEILLGQGVDHNGQDDSGMTPLHSAVHWGRISFVELLLKKGADANIGNKFKRTPLHIAASFNLEACINVLHQNGGDLEARDSLYGRTPLHLAASQGHEECVKVLLEIGAELDCRCHFGFTPLHLAIKEGRVDSCRVLLERGASLFVANKNGHTPLRLMKRDNLILSRLVLKYDPQPVHSAVIRKDIEFINELEVLGYDINDPDKNGNTPLHIAVDCNDAKLLIEKLIDLKADVTKQNHYGYTPLHYSIQSEFVNEEIVKLLLDCGQGTVNTATVKMITPLHQAAQGTTDLHVSITELLLGRGARIDARDDDGHTPLHYAACSGTIEIVSLLITDNVDTPTKRGRTALHMASTGGHLKVVQFLLDHNASVKTKDFYGETPLDNALKSEHPEVFKLLLEHDPDFDCCQINHKKRTLLHMSAKKGSLALVKFFLEKNVPVDAVDSDGTTALEDALFNRHYLVFDFLLEKSEFDVNKFNERYRRYPLHVVTSTDSLDLVKSFINLGARFDVVDDDGNTPLHNALLYNRVNSFLLLLNRCSTLDMRNNKGQTILHLAAILNQLTLTDLLIKNGANPDVLDNDNNTPFDILSNNNQFNRNLLHSMKNFDINRPSRPEKSTLLHQAVTLESHDTIEWLIQKGASINCEDVDGDTPLHYAAQKNVTILRLLLDKYQNSIDLEKRNKDGETILHLASACSLDNVREILRRGASPDCTTKFGATPLHYALKKREIFKFLWNKTSRAEIFTISGHKAKTVLHEAASDGDVGSVKFFLEIGLRINDADDKAVTPLIYAIQSKHLDILEVLLERDNRNVIVNICDKQGDSLLHLAAYKGCLDMVKLLVRNGARVDLCNDDGQTAADIASNHGYKQICDFLEPKRLSLFQKLKMLLENL